MAFNCRASSTLLCACVNICKTGAHTKEREIKGGSRRYFNDTNVLKMPLHHIQSEASTEGSLPYLFVPKVLTHPFVPTSTGAEVSTCKKGKGDAH